KITPERVAGTDFDAALCLAWSTVTQQPTPPECPLAVRSTDVQAEKGPVRSRAVVLVTDGFPAPEGADLTFSSSDSPHPCPAGAPGHEYMCRLIQRWRTLTATTPVDLYVIGIDRDDRWFSRAEPYWRAITGCQGTTQCATAVRRSAEPTSLVGDILNAGTGDL